MSINKVSFFRPPVEFISSGKHCYQNNKFLLLGSNEQYKVGLRRSRKMGVKYDDYTHTTPIVSMKVEAGCDVNVNEGGIGIDKFFQGKNIFITGATGLLGKVLVEKLLRSTPVGKIYLLVKAVDKEAALDRFSNESRSCSNVFEKKHGKSYKEFVQAKVIPVVGNTCEPNMGIDSYSANAIMEEVDVIIGSAANTNLNDRYDFLLDANVSAPQRLMRFAKRCKNLKLFVHISTAYVNGKREGIIYEKAYTMGEHGRNCINSDDETCSIYPWLDLNEEFNLALKSLAASTNHDTTKVLKMLGQERCSFYGWNNSYTMAKALGEMVVNEIREDVPVLIMRPSVIESSYKEPVPGWIQGKRMIDPVIIAYGKGQLPAFLANPEAILDMIPVDTVANTTIAAIAKHVNLHKSRDLNVYQVASSITNPLKFYEFFEYIYEYFNETPLVESNRISPIKFFNNFTDFSKYTREEISRRYIIDGQDEITKIQRQCNIIATYAEQMCTMYEFAGFFNARFHTGNTQKLMAEMSKKEQLEFDVDARNVNWKKYFHEIHVTGLRKYVLTNTDKAST